MKDESRKRELHKIREKMMYRKHAKETINQAGRRECISRKERREKGKERQ